jgi:NitT/TauT family transport system ATP-binding protein
VSIVGPSGCGKSTLLRALGGLLTPTSGVVRIAGRPPDEAKRRKRLGFVFQDASLLPWRSVIENVRLPLEVNRRAGGESPQVLVQLVGLTPFQDFYPHQLSGGMAQRAALARALVHNPEVLLMDEPLGALDELTRAQMRYEILQVWEQSRKTVVFVTHSVPEAVLLSDRVVVLTPAPGRIAGVVAVDLPRPRDEAVETSAPFHSRVEQVRRLLRKGDASVPQSEHRA